MSDIVIPATPVTAPAPDSMVAQMAAVKADSVAPVTTAPAPVPASAPTASPTPVPAAPATPDSQSDPKLAETEKRLKDTQAWAHQKAQEAARLKSELQMVLNNPSFQKAMESLGPNASGETPVRTQADLEIQAAFREYAAAPSDEEAFKRLIAAAAGKGRRDAVQEVEKILERRDAEQVVRQRNQLAKETIERTVASVAPDVPVELFWAMADRAERETPPQIVDETERLFWQTDRAIALSRQVMYTKIQAIRQAQQRQAAVRQAGQAVMAPGSGTVTAAPSTPTEQPKTMVQMIKERQAKLMGS